MEHFLTLISQSFITLIAFFLGKWQDRYKYKIEAYKERYLHLYCPFITIYISYIRINEKPKPDNLEFRNKILELIKNNILYLDTNSLAYFQFFFTMIKFKKYDSNKIFLNLIKSMLQECKHIEKNLKYPMKAELLLSRQNLLDE